MSKQNSDQNNVGTGTTTFKTLSAAASNVSPWTMGQTFDHASPHVAETPLTSAASVASAPVNHVNTKNNDAQTNHHHDRRSSLEIGMQVRETPSPLHTPSVTPPSLPNIPLLDQTENNKTTTSTNTNDNQSLTTTKTATTTTTTTPAKSPDDDHVKSQYEQTLSNIGITHPSDPLESVLAAACASIGFDIVEMWLRTGPRTHQLIHSHLRYSALDDTTRSALVDVYYGDSAPSRTHRLSPALCKRARMHNNIVWITSQTEQGAQALRCSLSGVLSAVAVPVCHEETQTNLTVIYFSMKRTAMQPVASEFLIHMSLAAAIVSVNNFDRDMIQENASSNYQEIDDANDDEIDEMDNEMARSGGNSSAISQSSMTSSVAQEAESYNLRTQLSKMIDLTSVSPAPEETIDTSRGAHSVRTAPTSTNMGRQKLQSDAYDVPPQKTAIQIDIQSPIEAYAVNGANLRMDFSDIRNTEYLTDGGNNWIHTAVVDSKPVVIKQLKPEVHDNISAMNEIEGELKIHSLLDHRNIVSIFGAGYDRRGKRFIVMERLDGGTLAQLLGYNTRIRDNRRRFFRKKDKLPYIQILKYAQQIAAALDYLHRNAVEGSMVLHRDIKPDNVGKKSILNLNQMLCCLCLLIFVIFCYFKTI